MRKPHRRPTHPGEFLRVEVMPALYRSAAFLAVDVGMKASEFEALLAEERAVEPLIAGRLATVLGGSAVVWTRI
jgi:addiction module HigA family antidote